MTQEMILVPKMVLKIITPDGFINLYQEMQKSHKTNIDAYEAVEELHEKYFGIRKYSEFQSFYVSLRRKIKHGNKS